MEKLSLAEVLKATGANSNFNGEIIFSGVTTDSRKITEGVLFVALKGENFNGEDFAEDSLKKGAAAVLVSDSAKNISGGVVLKVEDTLTAYQKISQSWRERFQIPVIAITGSNGKTTTKDLTAAALSPLGEIQKTSANFNNEIGVPLTLLGINEHHKAAVVEIGMRGLGQIESLAKIVKPNIGIVTNVNETHIEILKSVENIAKAKGELVEAIPSGGTVILNADNDFTAEMKKLAKNGVKIITYGIENPADLTAKNIVIEDTSTEFRLNYGNEIFDFEIPIIGRHNVSNALAAIAAGLTLGLSIKEIQRGFSTLATTKMRFEVIRRDGVTIVNDAYNASPASMRAAIQTVAEIYEGRKIAVLGDMLELGEISEKVHREVGEELAKNKFDTLITLGELGKFIADGAKDAGLKNIFTASTHEEVAKKILEIMRDGDIILFKASHGMHFEKIIELI
ncbi:MAG: UDP-N-acetylmuramoyl-tripeptide--D-alanyl-D-alanine ligase [Selenomonadaceae bacterium]|nr:UDP-N-acetylmuramoyl-tripeptide--D-alanyl-D-alanine ligase [Selenomonadaceae bacterium]